MIFMHAAHKALYALPFVFLLLSIAPSFALAAKLDIITPVQTTLSPGDTVDLGVVGPGQKLEIVASSKTYMTATTSKDGGQAHWDQLRAAGETLPSGWTYENGEYYLDESKLFIYVSPDAKDGDYTFQFYAIDEYEGAGKILVTAKVKVDKNVFSMGISPAKSTVAVGTPALFQVSLGNRASASDSIDLTLAGFPGAANYSKRIFLPHNSQITVPVEISSNEQGTYAVSFKAVSRSSPKINAAASGTMVSTASLFKDMQSAGYGLLLFPTSQQSVIGLLAFFSNAFGQGN